MRCANPITLKDPNRIKAARALVVPCGYCGACRHNRRTEWSFRLKEELKSSSTCYFVTLTYDNENLPYTDMASTGSLCKTDVQKFLKRVRWHDNNKNIRYYAVGEYGTSTHRPHYHAIMFNVSDTESIRKSWKLGHIKIDPINEARIHYVTKYHVNFDKRARKGIKEPEFALMSRKPGIGAEYLKKNSKWHYKNEFTFVINNGYKQAIPRYYKNKIFTEEEREALLIKSIPEQDKKYWEEYNRLDKIGISNPHQYMKDSAKKQAELVRKKGGKSDRL